jgi:tryptophan synthase alpha chain
MNRYQKVFSALRANHEAAFIPFAVAGDPDSATSETILKTYIDNGADILEIGYPFSDPIADGPVNQRGALRAIAAGIDHASFFKLIKNIRHYAGDIPIGILLYANTVRFPGYKSFCKAAAASGIDSLLVADMPPEEYEELGGEMAAAGLSRVFIVSELTPPDRMRMICDSVDAFVYVVSRLGTTGTASSLSGSIAATIAKLKSVTDKPLAVGFGISTPDHVRQVVAAGADGAIVGSALVKLVESYPGDAGRLAAVVGKAIRSFKAAAVGGGKR